jgi:hypothetical protein
MILPFEILMNIALFCDANTTFNVMLTNTMFIDHLKGLLNSHRLQRLKTSVTPYTFTIVYNDANKIPITKTLKTKIIRVSYNIIKVIIFYVDDSTTIDFDYNKMYYDFRDTNYEQDEEIETDVYDVNLYRSRIFMKKAFTSMAPIKTNITGVSKLFKDHKSFDFSFSNIGRTISLFLEGTDRFYALMNNGELRVYNAIDLFKNIDTKYTYEYKDVLNFYKYEEDCAVIHTNGDMIYHNWIMKNVKNISFDANHWYIIDINDKLISNDDRINDLKIDNCNRVVIFKDYKIILSK